MYTHIIQYHTSKGHWSRHSSTSKWSTHWTEQLRCFGCFWIEKRNDEIEFNSKPPESDLDGDDGLGRTSWISAQSLCHHLMLYLDLQVGFVSSLASNKFNSTKWQPAKEPTRISLDIWCLGFEAGNANREPGLRQKKWKFQNLNSMELLPLTFPWFIGIRKVPRHQMMVEILSDDKLFKNYDVERSGQDIGRCTLSLWQVSVQLHSACGIWVHQAQSWLPQLFHMMGDWMWLSMIVSA